MKEGFTLTLQKYIPINVRLLNNIVADLSGNCVTYFSKIIK